MSDNERDTEVNKDADDARWSALTDACWQDDGVDPEQRWGMALDLLQQYQNPKGALVLVAAGVPPPDWARGELAAWLAGERPPLPPGPKDDNDRRLLAAYRRCRDPAERKPGETTPALIERIATEGNVDPEALAAFHNCQGRPYRRLFKAPRDHTKVYDDLYKK